MAGNAVARPVGDFAADTPVLRIEADLTIAETTTFERHGMLRERSLYCVRHNVNRLAQNLKEFLDFASHDSLSNQAAAGLLVRAIKSRKPMPLPLFDVLYELSSERTKLRGTKVDSFKILHEQLDPLSYRSALLKQPHLEFGFT